MWVGHVHAHAVVSWGRMHAVPLGKIKWRAGAFACVKGLPALPQCLMHPGIHFADFPYHGHEAAVAPVQQA